MSFDPNILGAFVIGGLLTYIAKNKGYFEPVAYEDAPQNAAVPLQVASNATVPLQVASNATVPLQVASNATVPLQVAPNAAVPLQVAPNAAKEPNQFSIKAITNNTNTNEFSYYSKPRSFKDILNILQGAIESDDSYSLSDEDDETQDDGDVSR